jgi:hypothetical protein
MKVFIKVLTCMAVTLGVVIGGHGEKVLAGTVLSQFTRKGPARPENQKQLPSRPETSTTLACTLLFTKEISKCEEINTKSECEASYWQEMHTYKCGDGCLGGKANAIVGTIQPSAPAKCFWSDQAKKCLSIRGEGDDNRCVCNGKPVEDDCQQCIKDMGLECTSIQPGSSLPSQISQ